MAWYNPNTNTIEGATPGTMAWLHERGHQLLQERFKFYYYKSLISRLLVVLALLALGYGAPRLALPYVWSLYILEVIDEVWAWGYAIWCKIYSKKA